MSIDVGGHLKAVRIMYGLSQRELAKRAGVTNGTISLIEQNRVSPSVSSLKKVLDGVPMSLADFFTLDLQESPQVFYARDELADIGDRDVSLRLVAAKRPNRAMTIMHERYRPKADTGGDMLSHKGEEGGIILTGNIELTVGGQSRVLGPGDAYYFASAVPHRFRNVGDEPCEIDQRQHAADLLTFICKRLKAHEDAMKTTVAATQFASTPDRVANLATAERLVRESAKQGANIILIQELFETPYFCKEHNPECFSVALPIAENPAVRRFQDLARELNVVLPASVYERAGNAFYNTVAIIDADGSVLGTYRKAHIPESPGYHEKFYFSPGDTGFKVWPTRFGTIGVAICWDQWFPESARAMAVQGAEILFYPTAIGSEPQDLSIDSRDHWQRAMQGHAASNIMPLVASNRVGTEQGERWKVTYYGSSFIADQTGAILKQAPREGEAVLTATFDLDWIRNYRNSWGVFRDRRPELYGPIMTLDGQQRAR